MMKNQKPEVQVDKLEILQRENPQKRSKMKTMNQRKKLSKGIRRKSLKKIKKRNTNEKEGQQILSYRIF